MLKEITKVKRWATGIFGALLLCAPILSVTNCFADDSKGISLSPPNQIIALTAGETYTGSFRINNPSSNAYNFAYKISASPFYVDENYNIYYGEYEGLNQIVDWVTINTESGVLKPGDVEEIHYTINTPSNAPAGGQYLAITVSSVAGDVESSDDTDAVGANLKESMSMAYIVYAEVAGDTVRQGEIQSAEVPSFLLNGNITGSSVVKNTGNIHGTATYKLQVFPLFSNEEVFTNEEDPDSMIILPDRTYYSESSWGQTPDVGIFNVVYTVEFEGVTTQVSKMVIKCPVWLLFIIFFVIAAIIIWIVMRVRGRKKASSRRNSSNAAKSE